MDAPEVPVALADAMSARDTTVRPAAASTSVPIQPTAIVSTVDIGVDLSRTLRADAITAAVFSDEDSAEPSPTVMAYAAAAKAAYLEDAASKPAATADAGDAGIPDPLPNPLRDTVSALEEPAVAPAEPAREMTADEVYSRLPAATLTLTKLDTQGLRSGSAPCRPAKPYAVFTCRLAETLALLDKRGTFAARFDQVYRGCAPTTSPARRPSRRRSSFTTNDHRRALSAAAPE
jgi:hypothetical protein